MERKQEHTKVGRKVHAQFYLKQLPQAQPQITTNITNLTFSTGNINQYVSGTVGLLVHQYQPLVM